MNPILWLLGYRTLGTDAAHAAALLNLCLEQSAGYSGFAALPDGGVRFSCTLPTAHRLCRLGGARGIPVTVLRSGGLPMQLWARRRRAGLMLGTLCALALMVLSGRYVWDVRVTGNREMTAAEVKQELAECGFGVGSYLPDFSAGELENRVLLRSDRLAWISVNISGTVAEVQVVERVARPQEEPAKPANLVAARDGQIELIELFRGDCVVSIGQAVRAGELLVSGIYDSQTVGFRYTRAAGRILARTEHSYRIEIPLSYIEKRYTGSAQGDICLNFFQNSLKIYKSTGNDRGPCDIIETVNSLAGFGLHNLPFSVTSQTLRYYEEVPARRTPEAALELAYEQLARELGGLSDDTQLLRKDIRTTLTDDALILDCTVLCIENIAVQSEFEIVTEP